jgi:hypothetical protein
MKEQARCCNQSRCHPTAKATSELLVSACRDIMGGRINMYAAFGEGPLQWLHERHAQEVNYVVNSNGDTGAAKQPQDAGQHWWQGPPPHPLAAKLLQQALSERGPQRVSPGEWQVTAPNMHLSMRVWEVDSQGGGRPEDSFTLLHQPASLTLRFTQALSRWGSSLSTRACAAA